MTDGVWRDSHRPGYFGRRRDEKIEMLNVRFGPGNWRLVWKFNNQPYSFEAACRLFYEESYYRHLSNMDVDFICSFGECIDNARTNVASGLDYTKQEAFSTHIQDIAVRNVLVRLDRKFEGPADRILVIRSADSEGFRFNPGNVPFFEPGMIIQPELAPSWAKAGSVEAFWQSNKFVQIKGKRNT